MEHGKLLSRKFLKPSEKRGLGYGEMHEVDAGAAMEMMCPTCLTPRDPEKKKCLFCRSTEDAVHYTQPMASMLVDGKLWELRFEADGTYHWRLRCDPGRKGCGHGGHFKSGPIAFTQHGPQRGFFCRPSSSITPHQVEGPSCDQCPRSCPDGSPGQAQ